MATENVATTNGTSKSRLDVAVIGGGIIGVMVALGLLRRGFTVTVYERAAEWPEIGAAFAFTKVARECMDLLDPRVLESLAKVSQQSPHDKVNYWDGFTPRTNEAAQEDSFILFNIPEKNMAYWACLRGHLLLEMAGNLPVGVVKFNKQLINYEDEDSNDQVVMHFADESEAAADLGMFRCFDIGVSVKHQRC